MEEPNPINEEDQFFDALEDFPVTDSTITDQLEPSTSDSTLTHLEPSNDERSPEFSSSSTVRRRRSLSKANRHRTSGESFNVLEASGTNHSQDQTLSRERKLRNFRNLKKTTNEIDNSVSNQEQVSSIIDDLVTEPEESPSSHFLVYLAGLVIKLIEFQIKLFVRLFTFPIWIMYNWYSFVTDPFQITKRARTYMMRFVFRIWGIVCENISPSTYEWLKEQKSLWEIALRFGWGFLWAAYVCLVLCLLLVSSFVMSGLVIRAVVKEPIQMKETLNFDYTKNTPVALVPVLSCPDVTGGLNCIAKFEGEKNVGSRVVPQNHKLQVSVLMTLPESDYNRNLGMFQVRVDFLSTNGKVLGTLRRLCMLQYKSLPIRLLLTFMKTAPLVTGYSSESQTLSINMRGFTEGRIPTSCLKVMIEQRAEFRPGAGIPEIYDASLKLESELPLFKRLMWYWKKTLFVWISIMLFFTELCFSLVCCRCIIIPRARPRDGSAGTITQNI